MITNLQSLLDSLSLSDVLNFFIFLSLTFLGVSGRIMIEMERYDKKLKDIKFFNRYFLATILAYVLKLYMAESSYLVKYYSEVIIIFCIFVNDIVNFVFDNKAKLFLYILNSLTKGILDLKKFLSKDSKKNNE